MRALLGIAELHSMMASSMQAARRSAVSSSWANAKVGRPKSRPAIAHTLLRVPIIEDVPYVNTNICVRRGVRIDVWELSDPLAGSYHGRAMIALRNSLKYDSTVCEFAAGAKAMSDEPLKGVGI